MKTVTIDGIEYQLTPVPTETSKPVQWAPERLGKNQRYWFIDSGGGLYESSEDLLPTDTKRVSFGNYFHAESEAQEVATQVRQLLRLRAYVCEFAPGYTPNWCDRSVDKWFIYFDERSKQWEHSSNQFLHNISTVYMPQDVAIELARKLNNGEVVL